MFCYIFILLLNNYWRREEQKLVGQTLLANKLGLFYGEFNCGYGFDNIKGILFAKLIWTLVYIIIRIVLVKLNLPGFIAMFPAYLQGFGFFAEVIQQHKRKAMLRDGEMQLYTDTITFIIKAYRYVVVYQFIVWMITIAVPELI